MTDTDGSDATTATRAQIAAWRTHDTGALEQARRDRRRYLALPSDQRARYAHTHGFVTLTDLNARITRLAQHVHRWNTLLTDTTTTGD